MKILVTGGAGFIGSNFVRRTIQDAYAGLDGAEVVVLEVGSNKRRISIGQ